MRTFGPQRWGPSIDGDVEHDKTPVGWSCLGCDEPIAEGDSGVLMPYLKAIDQAKGIVRGEWAALHRECHLRGIFGSLGHQLGVCGCPGKPAIFDDPPGITRRQAARLAVQLFEMKQEAARSNAGAPEGR